jgi:S1-C subfamily serine protease
LTVVDEFGCLGILLNNAGMPMSWTPDIAALQLIAPQVSTWFDDPVLAHCERKQAGRGQMRRWNRIILLLCAASLFIGRAHPGRLLAADTAVISSTPTSQVYSTNSLRPSASSQVAPYQTEQNTSAPEPQGLKEYMDANEQISVLGIDLRVETRKAEKEIQGLLVVNIASGTPGAAAGLHPYRQPVRDLLNGVGMLATMAFPPAMVVVPIVESVPLGEAYDLIIGVDGSRVTNFLDFYDCMRNVQPGEIIYLNILRNGRRVQVPMQITSAVPPPESWVR